MRRPGSLESSTPHRLLEHLVRRVVGDVAIAGEFVRERAHVARALHVVLTAQRVHADALAADIAGRHREIGHRHHRRRALRMFGDAEPVVDRAIAALGVEPRGGAHVSDGSTPVRAAVASGECRSSAMKRAQDSKLAGSQRSRTKASSTSPSVDDHMRERVDDGDVRARPQREMMVRLDMRRAHEVDAARDRRRSASRPRAAASSSARRTPDARRSDWRR